MPFKNIEERRKYQREWTAKRRADWITKRGPCAKCGSSESLEVDHIDPNKKITHRVWNWSKERMEKELRKCQVLCGKHHKEKTAQFRAQRLFHGNASMYHKGCRCDLCRTAASQAKAEWREKTGKH